MTGAVGAVETIVNSAGALRNIAGELKAVIGDHALITEVEKLVTDIEAAVAEIPAAATTVEKVAEGVWDKIAQGFDDLFHPHRQSIEQTVKAGAEKVAGAVDAHTAAVADAVTQAVATAQPVLTGPGGPPAARVVSGGGAPAASQPLPGPRPVQPAGSPDLVDTGKVINTTDAEGNNVQQPVMDAPHGPSENITIT